MRLLTAGRLDVAGLSAVYAALAAAGVADRWTPGRLQRMDAAVDRFLDQVRAACDDVLRELARQLPRLAEEIDPAAGRTGAFSWINAYAEALAARLDAAGQDEVRRRVAPGYRDLVATIRSLSTGPAVAPDPAVLRLDALLGAGLRRLVLSKLTADGAGKPGGLAAALAIVRHLAPPAEMVAIAGANRTRSTVRTTITTAVADALRDPRTRAELVEAATDGVRATVDDEFAVVRRGLTTGDATFAGRLDEAQRRIEQILDRSRRHPPPQVGYRPRHAHA